VEVSREKKTIIVSEDDHRRPETTMEILKTSDRPSESGIVTAG